MSRDCLLGLDLGSSVVRALLVGADGAVRARAWRPLGTQHPAPDRVEQDPAEMWSASIAVLREALAGGGRRAEDVAGIGVATQRATALAWDADSGAPLAPALSWQDRRTAGRVEELRARGIPVTTLPSATKVEWLLRRDPAVREAAAAGRLRIGTPDTWLTSRLTEGDAHVTDPGQASCTGLYDPGGDDWSDPALALFGIERAALPRVVDTAQVVGETPAALLGARVPVAARAGDQQAACFAQGVHAPGDAKLTLGTAAMLDVHAGARPPRPRGGAFPLALWRFAEGATARCLEGTVITAGAAVEWLVSVGLLPSAEALDAVAGSVADSEGVVFVPALEGLGTPFVDTAARGWMGGITRGSRSAHVVRAALDGIAHRCVDVCEALALDARPLRVDGGLTRSALLLQRLADLGGRPLLRAAETETTSLGAALLAGLATRLFPSPDACRAALAPPRRVDPAGSADATAHERRRWRAALERARGASPGG